MVATLSTTRDLSPSDVFSLDGVHRRILFLFDYVDGGWWGLSSWNDPSSLAELVSMHHSGGIVVQMDAIHSFPSFLHHYPWLPFRTLAIISHPDILVDCKLPKPHSLLHGLRLALRVVER